MKAADYDVRESDPFEEPTPIKFDLLERSPYVNRIRLMWHDMRKEVMDVFPKAPGLPEDKDAYIKTVEDIYTTDAFHSLSIERYTVTPELIMLEVVLGMPKKMKMTRNKRMPWQQEGIGKHLRS